MIIHPNLMCKIIHELAQIRHIFIKASINPSSFYPSSFFTFLTNLLSQSETKPVEKNFMRTSPA